MVTKEEIDAFVDFCRGADDIRVTSATWGRVVPALADENDRLAELVMKAAKDKVEYEDENDRLRAQLAEAVALLGAAERHMRAFGIGVKITDFLAKLKGTP